MFERFTEKGIKVITLAQNEARRLGHNYVGTELILLGLIGEGTGIASKTLKSMGVNLQDARVEVERIIGRGSGFVATEIPFTQRAKRVLEYAWDEARQLGHNYIGTEHQLLGLIREKEGVGARSLENLGVELTKVRSHVMRLLGKSGDSTTTSITPATIRYTKTPKLDEHGVDLTQWAQEGKLDPLVGREIELERMLRILTRRAVRNPLLVGESGVGKFSLIGGLAKLLTTPELAPESLKSRRIISIDVINLLSLEDGPNCVQECMFEAATDNAILVIWDVHLLLVPPLIDLLSNAFIKNPYCAEKSLLCIGVAPLKEYKNFTSGDETHTKYFQPIFLNPTSVKETITILGSAAKKLETYHNLTIGKEAIEQTVKLSNKINSNRFFPGKALEILDAACSLARARKCRPAKQQIELRKIRQEKEKAIKNQEFERAASLRDQETRMSDQLRAISKDNPPSPIAVTHDDVADVLNAWKSASEQLFAKKE